jgi:Flp pilus assembly protein TadG
VTPVSRRCQRAYERGAVAVFVALFLALLIALLGLAINGGHMLVVRNELQNAADSGALAGAGELRLNQAGAGARACEYAALNRTDRTPVNCNPATDVTPVCWDPLARQNSPTTYVPQERPVPSGVNAVKVGATLPQLRVFLSGFVGMTNTDVRAREAIGFSGGPCRGTNVLPLIITECNLRNNVNNCLIPRCNTNIEFSRTGLVVGPSFRMTPLTAAPPPLGVQVAVLAAFVLAPFNPTPGIGQTVGSRTNLPGVVVDNAWSASYAAALNLLRLSGQTVRVPVRECNGTWSGQVPVAGFARVTVLGCGNCPVGAGLAGACTAASTSICLRLQCGSQMEPTATPGACPNYGTWAGQPVLVDVARPP